MHWLPLVAMVIASALFFLRCPLPRLVVARMEPGNNIRTSSSAEYNSKSNDSHRDFNSSANDSERAPHQTAGAYNGKDSTLALFMYKDPLFKRKQSQEILATEGHPASTGDQMDLRLQGLKSQARKTFKKDSRVPVDYKAKGGQFQDSGNFEGAGTRGRKTLLKDRNSDMTRSRKALVKVRHNEDNSMVNQQLPDLLPVDGDGVEIGKEILMPAEGLDLNFDEALQEDEELLMLASHPRVLFTASPVPPKHPPLQFLLESGLQPEEVEDEEHRSSDVNRMQLETTAKPSQERQVPSYRDLLLGLSPSARPSPALSSQSPHKVARQRRQVGLEGRERAACESVSKWVLNRKTAIDLKMRNVTVISAFETKKGKVIQQVFYETRCRESDSKEPSGEHGVAGGDCLGVDKKHWASECRTKQSYVKAFISDSNGRMSWNWIRIDSSCVCVLQNKKHKNQWQGQGIR